MMALSGGTEAIDFGHRGGCCGGCYGRGSQRCCGGGCYGGYSAPVYGGGVSQPWGGQPGMQPAPLGAPTPGAAPNANPPVTPKKGSEQEVSAPATIVVSLPADARLFVDGSATRSTSARRTLVTPAIERTADYVYNLRAEVVRDGQTQVQTQQVTVRGGQTTEVPFNFSAQGVASR